MVDKITIVACDDDETQLMLVQYVLGKQHEVITTTQGNAVADLCRKHKPALVLLDIVMPAPDGITVLQDLKAAADIRDLPVVMFTSDGR